MSGEVIQYASLKKPMSWSEFKELPDDLKKEYIKSIREKFGAPDTYIAQMFGTSQRTLCMYFKDLGLGLGKHSGASKRKWKTEEFLAWQSGADLEAGVNPVPEETIESDTEPEIPSDSSSLSDEETCGGCCEVNRAVPKNGQMLFTCKAEEALNTIQLILGDKEVELFVEWRIVED